MLTSAELQSMRSDIEVGKKFRLVLADEVAKSNPVALKNFLRLGQAGIIQINQQDALYILLAALYGWDKKKAGQVVVVTVGPSYSAYQWASFERTILDCVEKIQPA